MNDQWGGGWFHKLSEAEGDDFRHGEVHLCGGRCTDSNAYCLLGGRKPCLMSERWAYQSTDSLALNIWTCLEWGNACRRLCFGFKEYVVQTIKRCSILVR